jgi:hypothetical protein
VITSVLVFVLRTELSQVGLSPALMIDDLFWFDLAMFARARCPFYESGILAWVSECDSFLLLPGQSRSASQRVERYDSFLSLTEEFRPISARPF